MTCARRRTTPPPPVISLIAIEVSVVDALTFVHVFGAPVATLSCPQNPVDAPGKSVKPVYVQAVGFPVDKIMVVTMTSFDPLIVKVGLATLTPTGLAVPQVSNATEDPVKDHSENETLPPTLALAVTVMEVTPLVKAKI